MKRNLNWAFLASLLFVVAMGCDSPRTNAPSAAPDKPDAKVDVKTGPGGAVDVEVGREGKPGAKVDVGPGGVDVKVDRDAIRENAQERRAERAEERAIERAEDAAAPK